MIRLSNICKRYAEGPDALKEINLFLEKGSLSFLTGHSGAGKSTLLRLIALIERPTRGQLLVNGENLSRVKARSIPYLRRKMGIIFQNHQLLMDRSVYDNVALPLIVVGFRHQDISRRVRAALDKVGLLDKEHRYPISLSSGEQQRVGIARAVVHKPQILLADEPTGNLDPDLSREIMELFEQFSQVGVTTLIASHDLTLITQMHHNILTLDQGRLVHIEGYQP